MLSFHSYVCFVSLLESLSLHFIQFDAWVSLMAFKVTELRCAMINLHIKNQEWTLRTKLS